ncbi:MAG TPA: FHA domain-containing protein [Nitrosomonas sp.]|nr:FHA domain-containing protein [Nitrosomonas sp.]
MEHSKSSLLSTLLSWVPEEMRIWLLFLIILTLIFFIILFRQEIGRLLERLRNFHLSKNGFELVFEENIKQAKQQKRQNADLTGISKTGIRLEADYPNLSSRDLVLEAWVSLKQNIYDVVVAQKIQLTVATSPFEALGRLKSANIISADLYDHIKLLLVIGRLAADTTKIPSKRYAGSYHELVYDVLDWMMSNAFLIKVHKPSESFRKTQVGGDVFPSPSPGRPAARLIAISGPQKGHHYNLEKDIFTIGANSNNDLMIVGDNFVSGTHAQLRYSKGCIILSDKGSKNGTFLNGTKLNDVPMAVKTGDKIEIGNTIFELN